VRDATAITSELIASGLSPTQTALLMELVLSMSTGLSGGANPAEPPDRALLKRRAWDRDRQARKREAEREAKRLSTLSTGHPVESTGQSGGNADVCSNDEEKKNRSLSVKKERKQGSRLQSSARVSDENRAIAIECGCPPDRVDAVWTEFVDYWSDIPGQKGCKLSWTGTWRNRVKQLFGTGFGNGKSHGTTQNKSVSAVAKRIAEQFESQSRDSIEGNPNVVFRLPAR